jgi:hypothetical protein
MGEFGDQSDLAGCTGGAEVNDWIFFPDQRLSIYSHVRNRLKQNNRIADGKEMAGQNLLNRKSTP